MPTSQRIELIDGLKATVELSDECKEDSNTIWERVKAETKMGYTTSGERTLFFTDECPYFHIEITNNTEYDFIEGSQISWCVAIGEGMPEPVYSGTIDIELSQGETKKYELGGNLLAFEGHGVVGLTSGGHSGRGNSAERELSSGNLSTYSPVYTFSIWDREEYREIHQKTREAQEASTTAALILMFIGLAQLLLFLYQIGVLTS